jgi:hypothetical protein
VSFVWYLSFVKTFTDSTLLIFMQNHSVWKIFREITLVTILWYVTVVQTFTIGTFMSIVFYLSRKDIYVQFLGEFCVVPVFCREIW